MSNNYKEYGILAIGRGCANSYGQLTYLMALQNEFDKLCMLYGCEYVKQIMKTTSCSVFEIENYINKNKEDFLIKLYGRDFVKQSEDAVEMWNTIASKQFPTIAQLKSQLKYCKNPLQKLNLERELNRLIREKRKEVNNGS